MPKYDFIYNNKIRNYDKIINSSEIKILQLLGN